MRARGLSLAVVTALGVGLAGAPGVSSAQGGAASGARTVPSLTVTELRSGLNIPWDIAFVDSTHYLLTERSGKISYGDRTTGSLTQVSANQSDVPAAGEGGLLGLAVDPAFASNRRFYTCQTNGPANDNRVVRWTLAAGGVSAVRAGAPVVKGIPRGTIHNGCRVLFGPGGKLFVSTGDAATGRAPQSLTNLGGKILRVNKDGTIPRDNPWPNAADAKRRYVWNYGHRNPQGLAWRPGTTQLWNSEHGPDRDDEVNLVLKARNYGWNPVRNASDPSYYQQVPMTDLAEFPNAVAAKWSSGVPTLATSGMTFISGASWGDYNGVAFVAQLKGSGVLALWLDAAGTVLSTAEVPELNDTYGRLRTVRMGPDGALYVLTSNGASADKILRVTPNP